MKKLLLCSFLVFTCFSFSGSAQDLSGKWQWNSEDGQVAYSLDLNNISDERLSGVHCIENFQREIKECVEMEDEDTVTLVKIADNIYQGNLLTGAGGNKTVQDIQIQYLPLQDKILFTVTKGTENSYLVPVKAILQR